MRQQADRHSACLRVEVELKQSVMYYQPRRLQPHLKIVVATPTLMNKAKGVDGAHPPRVPVNPEKSGTLDLEA